MNQTQLVRNAINVFIVVAVGISLLQELTNVSSKSPAPVVSTPDGQPLPPEPTGPQLQGIRILSSDSFQAPLKQLLAQKQLNIEVTPYEFQGNDYWMNMIANWGHVAIIFYFMTKHKNETDAGKKKQIMIMGALAVVGWFYFSPKLRPQRLAIEVKGRKVYEKDYFVEQEVAYALDEEEFEIEEMNQNLKTGEPLNQKTDAWAERKQEVKEQEPERLPTQEEVMQEIF